MYQTYGKFVSSRPRETNNISAANKCHSTATNSLWSEMVGGSLRQRTYILPISLKRIMKENLQSANSTTKCIFNYAIVFYRDLNFISTCYWAANSFPLSETGTLRICFSRSRCGRNTAHHIAGSYKGIGSAPLHQWDFCCPLARDEGGSIPSSPVHPVHQEEPLQLPEPPTSYERSHPAK